MSTVTTPLYAHPVVPGEEILRELDALLRKLVAVEGLVGTERMEGDPKSLRRTDDALNEMRQMIERWKSRLSTNRNSDGKEE